MKTRARSRLWALAVALWCGCDDGSSGPCPRGEELDVQGHDLCVYEGGVVVETGWTCPPARPVFYEVGDVGICSVEDDLDEAVLNAAEQEFSNEIGGDEEADSGALDVGFGTPDGSGGEGEPPSLRIELRWDTGHDLDLHLLRTAPEARWEQEPFDCHWANTSPDWSQPPDHVVDCRLDIDDADGEGPENITVERMERSVEYKVGVHFHGAGSASASTTVASAQTTVYVNGLVEDQRVVELENLEFCNAFVVTWLEEGGEVEVVDGDEGCWREPPL